MKTIVLGATGRHVSFIGLGGEGVLRTSNRRDEAREVILAAIDRGITYFDSARVYSDSEVYYGSIWKEKPSLRQRIFQTSKSASRGKDAALTDLHSSLARLQTDYLDLWQIHDIRSEKDLRDIAGSGGALEAFVEAKEQGKIRHIGVTGHHAPAVLTHAVREWPVDSVLLPVNPVEGIVGGFLTDTLAAAREKGIAVIGMKVLGGGNYVLPELGVSAGDLIRYALSFDISLPIVGCASPTEVQMLLDAGKEGPLDCEQRKELEDRFRPYALRLAYYRGTR